MQYLASVYDPTGLISPTVVRGKMIFRETCNLKIGWDTKLPDKPKRKWERWKQSLPTAVRVLRSIPELKVCVQKIDLHALGDASKDGFHAPVYSILHQSSGISQGLLCLKPQLSKQDLTIPRLELVACHISVNLIDNAKKALTGHPVGQLVPCANGSAAL